MISQTRVPLPPVQPLKQSPTVTRVNLEDTLPKTLSVRYVEALKAAGWSFCIHSVSLQGPRGRTASLEALKYDFQLWLNNQKEFPSYQRQEALNQDVLKEALSRLPKVGGLLQ